MLNNLILWVRTVFMATPATNPLRSSGCYQWASQKLSDREICDAIITTMNNPQNNYDLY